MSSVAGKKGKECSAFEPQTWRKNLCKNCFKTADQHGPDKNGADDNGKKDKSKDKDKDKAAPGQGLLGKISSGGKQKGEDTKPEKKLTQDKGKKDTDTTKDVKDKKDKPLFGRFAGKAKEKVIEATQVVEKKTPLGGKKKGLEQKTEDKNETDKTKGKGNSVLDTGKKTDGSSDKDNVKDVTPKVKKKWPFDKFETSSDKAKGKLQKDPPESPKATDSPKGLAKGAQKDRQKESPKVQPKNFPKSGKESPTGNEKKDGNGKSPKQKLKLQIKGEGTDKNGKNGGTPTPSPKTPGKAFPWKSKKGSGSPAAETDKSLTQSGDAKEIKEATKDAKTPPALQSPTTEGDKSASKKKIAPEVAKKPLKGILKSQGKDNESGTVVQGEGKTSDSSTSTKPEPKNQKQTEQKQEKEPETQSTTKETEIADTTTVSDTTEGAKGEEQLKIKKDEGQEEASQNATDIATGSDTHEPVTTTGEETNAELAPVADKGEIANSKSDSNQPAELATVANATETTDTITDMKDTAKTEGEITTNDNANQESSIVVDGQEKPQNIENDNKEEVKLDSTDATNAKADNNTASPPTSENQNNDQVTQVEDKPSAVLEQSDSKQDNVPGEQSGQTTTVTLQKDGQNREESNETKEGSDNGGEKRADTCPLTGSEQADKQEDGSTRRSPDTANNGQERNVIAPQTLAADQGEASNTNIPQTDPRVSSKDDLEGSVSIGRDTSGDVVVVEGVELPASINWQPETFISDNGPEDHSLIIQEEGSQTEKGATDEAPHVQLAVEFGQDGNVVLETVQDGRGASGVDGVETAETTDSLTRFEADEIRAMAEEGETVEGKAAGPGEPECGGQGAGDTPTAEAPPEADLSAPRPPVVTSLPASTSEQEAGAAKSQEILAQRGDTEFTQHTPAPGEAGPSNRVGEDKNTLPLAELTKAEPRKDDPPAPKTASQSEITYADSAVIHSKENSQVGNDVNTNWKAPGPSSEEQVSDFSTPFNGDVNSEGAASTPTLQVSTLYSHSPQQTALLGEEAEAIPATSPVRVETTITLTGSPRAHAEQEQSAAGSGLAATDFQPSNQASSDFALPRSGDINPSQVIVHTGPTYHSPDEATTSFITDDQGGYSIAPGHVTSSIFHHQPGPISPCINDWYNTGAQRSQTDDDVNLGETQTRRRRRDRQNQVRRRQRQSLDDSDFTPSAGGLYGDSTALNMNRDDAMMEGTRMLIDNLRDKISIMEEKMDKMDREKAALADLLTVKKSEYVEMRSKYRGRMSDLEDDVNRLTAEKDRLMEKLKLPESERAALISSDKEIAVLVKKIEELESQQEEVLEENLTLKQEVKDLQLEMEEMHDQFREEEALEFRELQKELEATAKNCRILQFKLRKSERRNEQMDSERCQYEDKIRQLESRFKKSDDKQHIHELEEELKMAKEVSVRLHDELELVEEKRARYEEELDRVNDILTESESRRQALQREVNALTDELDRQKTEELDKKTNNTLGVPARAPLLGQTKKDGSKEGSMEYDVAQLMRDLSDSLERENDLKEQLKFAEEEARIMRKKLLDLDEENESLQLQLQKLSSAKSPKHYRKKDTSDPEVVTEREHDLRLQMDLAENEVKVLKRKLDEMEQQNENLLDEVKFLQAKMDGKVDGRDSKLSIEDDERPLEEQITSMAREIDNLKYKLTEKDLAADDKTKGGRGILKKSKSLEEDMHGPGRGILADAPDMRSQLERVEQEANVLKDRLLKLDKENDRIQQENKKLQLMSTRKLPSITADDSALQNIELHEQVAQLESENTSLRDSLKCLDDRTAQLSKQVFKSASQESLSAADSSEIHSLKEQLKNMDEDCRRNKRKIAELESANIRLTRDLRKFKKEEESSEDKKLKSLSRDDLEDRVLDLESELKGLLKVLKSREEEIDKLEADIEGTKFDMDKIVEVFKQREIEILEDADMIQQKNNVLSNLLDLVTERAESTQKELEKYVQESVLSSSPTSPTTEELPEKKEKKKKGSGDKGKVLVAKEWEEEMNKRVNNLEHALAEAREKLEAKEKKLEMKDSKMTGIKRDTKVNKKEMEVLQKELALCTKQLRESVEEVKDLKARLVKVQESHKSLTDDYDTVFKELEEKKEKVTSLESTIEEEKEKSNKAVKPEKEPASWRWEKKQLEDSVKELEKSVDKLKSELKQQHFKWKLAGEDKEKETKMKEKLDNQIQNLKTQLEENQAALEEAKAKADSIQENFKRKEDQWNSEKQILLDNAKAAEKDSQKKDESLKLKDDIISEKDELIKEKNKAVKDKEKSLKKKDEIIKSRDEEIQEKTKSLSTKEEELAKTMSQMGDLQTQAVEKDEKLKTLNADVRRRDDRIKEKDEILDKINRKLKEREQEYNDMDNSIRQIMKKLQDKEGEMKSLRTSAEKNETEVQRLNKLVTDLQTQMEKSELRSKKEYSDVSSQKDKLESELSTVNKEKKALLSDLNSTKEKLKSGEDKWKKEKTKLEVEIKQSQEKLHSLELSRTMKQGDVVKTLSKEKEGLISEKHKMSDEVNKLKKEYKESTKQWNTERDDLQKIIAEKTKMLEDNSSIQERMQKEIDNLKSRTGSKSPAGTKLIPIQVQHEAAQIQSFPVRVQTEPDKKPKGSKESTEAAVGKERELQIKLEQKELLFKAEKAGLEELYEGKLKLSQDNLAYAQEQINSMKKESNAQLELLQGSRKALADLRSRYDAALLSWNEDRDRLEKKLSKVDTKSDNNAVDKQLKEIQVKLVDAEAKAKAAEAKLSAEQNTWKVEKASLEKKVKTASAAAPAGPPGKAGPVSDFRARFEKFEKKAPAGPPAKGGAAVSTAAEDKAVTEAQKAIKDLKKQMETMEKEREKATKELLEKIEKQPTGTTKKEKGSDKAKIELEERNTQLENKLKQLDETTKSLVELQHNVHEERENWQIEKKQIFKQLEDSRQSQMSDKEKINELLAELKKLKTLAPMLENGQQEKRSRLRRTPSVERQRTIIALSKAEDTADGDDEVKRSLDQPLSPDSTRTNKQVASFTIKPGSRTHIQISRGLQSSSRPGTPSNK